MYPWTLRLNLAATLTVVLLSLWSQGLAPMVFALPFLLTLTALRRQSTLSFYYTGLIVNAVALIVGVWAVTGAVLEASFPDSLRRELMITVAGLGYVLTPLLNLLTLRRRLRTLPPWRK